MGDEVQAIKAGVLEIADLFAVNKADRDGAEHTVMALQMMQGLSPDAAAHHRMGHGGRTPEAGVQPGGSWLPPIVKTVATRGEGVETLREWIEKHAATLRESGQLAQRERLRAAAALDHILRDQLLAALLARLPDGTLPRAVEAVARRDLDPYTVAAQLLAGEG